MNLAPSILHGPYSRAGSPHPQAHPLPPVLPLALPAGEEAHTPFTVVLLSSLPLRLVPDVLTP